MNSEEYVEDDEVVQEEETIEFRYGQEPIKTKQKEVSIQRYDETNEAIAAGRRLAELSNKNNRRKVLHQMQNIQHDK